VAPRTLLNKEEKERVLNEKQQNRKHLRVVVRNLEGTHPFRTKFKVSSKVQRSNDNDWVVFSFSGKLGKLVEKAKDAVHDYNTLINSVESRVAKLEKAAA